MSAFQLSLFDPMPAPLDAVEAYVRSILESRKRANASGQLGEDVKNIRAAYLQCGNAGSASRAAGIDQRDTR